MPYSGGGMLKTMDGFTMGWEFATASISAQKVNILGGLQINDQHDNIKIGDQAAYFLTSGRNNTALGLHAGYYLTTGEENFIAGSQAGYNIGSSTNCLAIGNDAMYTGNQLTDNVALGNRSLYSITGTGNSGNVAVGYNTGAQSKEDAGVNVRDNVLVGNSAGLQLKGSNNVVMGTRAGTAGNTANTMGECQNAVFVGYESGNTVTKATDVVAIGTHAGKELGTSKRCVFVGTRCGKTAENVIDSVMMGVGCGEECKSTQSSVLIGHACGKVLTGNNCVMVGNLAGSEATVATNSVCIGLEAGKKLTLPDCVCIGTNVANDTTLAEDDVIIGTNSGTSTTTKHSVIVGNSCAQALTGDNCVVIGSNTAQHITGTNNKNNIFIGTQTGEYATQVDATTVSDNVVMGNMAGRRMTGNHNVIIGTDAGTSGNADGQQGNCSGVVLIGNKCGNTIVNATDMVCIGTETGLSLGTSSQSVLIGRECGKNATSSANVVMIGSGCCSDATNATDTVSIGTDCGKETHTSGCVFIGNECGQKLVFGLELAPQDVYTETGKQCVMIGNQCGKIATGATSSVYMGNQAGYAVSGIDNVIIGTKAMYSEEATTSRQNVCIGSGCGDLGVWGLNVAIGYKAMGKYDQTTINNQCESNVAIGLAAMADCGNSYRCVALGELALKSTIDHYACVCIGSRANCSNDVDNAVCIGTAALCEGSGGIAIGYEAKTQSGANISLGNTAVSYYRAVAVGYGAQANGEESLAIGYGAKCGTLATKSTAIGTGAVCNAPNTIVLGGPTTTHILSGGGGTAIWTSSSDRKLKENIIDSHLGLAFINAVQPRSYKFKDREWQETNEKGETVTVHHRYKRQHCGFVAQEVKEVMTSQNVEFAGFVDPHVNGNSDPDAPLAMNYLEFIAPMVKAIQELHGKVKELQTRLSAYEAR